MKTRNWTIWLSLIFVATAAGWMIFDGTRALIVGDYVTPKTGEYAGQLGPWSTLVQAVGIEPRSTWMKLIFIAQGLATLAAVVNYLLNKPRARVWLFAAVLLGLWYLPIGTLMNLTALIILLLSRRNV